MSNKEEVQIQPELESVIPSMNLTVPNQVVEEKQPVVTEDMLIGIYQEVIDNLRQDRKEMDGYITNLADMVFNEDDGQPATKEALVNLLKTKSETSDKMAKIADLMTRVVLKERDTFPRYLAAHQNNTINIGDAAKRDLLKQIDKTLKKKKEG